MQRSPSGSRPTGPVESASSATFFNSFRRFLQLVTLPAYCDSDPVDPDSDPEKALPGTLKVEILRKKFCFMLAIGFKP
jgi:hypothetical protein